MTTDKELELIHTMLSIVIGCIGLVLLFEFFEWSVKFIIRKIKALTNRKVDKREF